jgi:hypothetical protein
LQYEKDGPDECTVVSSSGPVCNSKRSIGEISENNLLLTISAPGYKKWVYHDPSDPSRLGFIRWEPNEEKELLVELEPEASAAR